MSKFFFITLLVLVHLTSTAQNYDQEVDFGVKGAYDITNYSEFKRSDIPDGYDLRNYGYMAGLFLQLRVNHIYFQPELLFNHVSTVIAAPLPNDPVQAEIDMDFSSIQIPLVVGYRTGFKNSAFRIGGGVYFDFLMASSGEFILDPGGSAPLPDSYFDGFNTLRIGARFNAGFDVGRLLFDVSHQRGFSRLAEELGELGVDFTELGRESTWIFSVGYKFVRSKVRSGY